MEQFTWYLTRSTGITAYVLLFAVVALGLVLSGPGGAWWRDLPVLALHRFLTWLMSAFLAVHVLVLLANHFLHFGPLEILLPFLALYERFWTGVGVIALYLLALVIITTVLRKRLQNTVWYGLHLLSYPAFVAATAHGIMTGSDTRKPWLLVLYLACTVITGAALVQRFVPKETRGPRAADTPQQVRRFGPGALAAAALTLMIVVLLGSRLAR